jgi:DNA-binding MarR family transcriptional regulator
MAMVPDVEKIEENRLKFLTVLYEIANEYVATNDVPDSLIGVGEGMWAIGERAGLTRPEADRASTELEESGLVSVTSAVDDSCPRYTLTLEGCRVAEKHLYEKSSLAKRRKIVGAIKEKSAAGAMSLMKEGMKLGGTYLAGILTGAYGPALTKWVKEMLDMK